MKLSDKFIVHETEDGKVTLVSTDTSAFSGIVKGNKTAAVMLELLKKDVSKEEIVDALCEKYDAPREKLEADVEKFIATLTKVNAIEF